MFKSKKYIVTGIGTDVGKTVASAVLCTALNANYWKPVQAGTEPMTDTERVRGLIPEHLKCFEEHLVLQTPMSPHAAADLEGEHLEIGEIEVPHTLMNLIIEGAGGVMVPLNDTHHYLDLFRLWGYPVIVVIRHYLGSINHSLMTINTLQNAQVPIAGIVYSGEKHPSSESVIESMTGINVLARIPEMDPVDTKGVQDIAEAIKSDLEFLK